ncbi:SSI family serine proteinase inhibitor [Streptomyces sp. NPDC101160]|uniref:SSI family serine proteinase inhibitor n=1 Tax=Streptomyces sp. NPDC101160 TaxID=3366118 RepID=UPI0037F5E37B
MRSFRTLGATALATASGLALIGTAIAGTGTAEAAPASTPGLYAPTALVLTLGRGERPATATVVRAVTLSCSPSASGTHPAPVEACRELTEVDGNFARLARLTRVTAPERHVPCTREWDPVTVTGVGVWEGRQVRWSARYGNACELRAATGEGTVFAF